MSVPEVYNVESYINVIEQMRNNYSYTVPLTGVSGDISHTITPRYIFRGHGNHNEYPLLPGILRYKHLKNGNIVGQYSQFECEVLMDFISEAKRYIPGVHENDVTAWLEIAQHFAVPTRLLDFTENPLVALYFACCDKSDCDASVWIINQDAYNTKFFNTPTILAPQNATMVSTIVDREIIRQDFLNHNHPNDIQYPIIYKPKHREERMAAQSSLFMLWGARRNKLTDFFNIEEWILFNPPVFNPQNRVIGYISIPSIAKERILNQLDLLGVNEKLIYPGLDGVGKYIKQKYVLEYNVSDAVALGKVTPQ